MSSEQVYPTDLTDAQWERLAPLIPPPKPGGRRRTVDMRQVCNAIFYIDRSGCQWRMLPKEYPNWRTVYWYFTRWQDDGTWERITDALRRMVRQRSGRHPEPSAAILDSQSVKTTQKRSYPGVKPRRRGLMQAQPPSEPDRSGRRSGAACR